MSDKSDRTGEEDAASDDDDENATINNSSIQEASDTIGTSPPVVPVDGLALDRINDILDFETEHILNDRSTRFEHYECLAFFWNTHPAKTIAYGRRYVLLFLAELMVIACGRPPHDVDEPGGVQKRFLPLYALDHSGWEDLENDLDTLRALLLRKDATVNYSCVTDTQDDASEVDLGRSKSSVFGEKYDLVADLIRINKAIAPIRKQIEDQIAANIGNFSMTIAQSKIDEICRNLETNNNDNNNNEKVLEAVRSLFVKKEESDGNAPNAYGGYKLIDDDALVAQLRASPFDLYYFQNKVEILLHRMMNEVFQNDQSVLMGLRYTISPNSAMNDILKTPRKSRRHVISEAHERRSGETRPSSRSNHEPDENNTPQQEALPSHSQVPQSHEKPRLRAPREEPPAEAVSRPYLEIVEELDMDDREELWDRAKLSTPVKKARVDPIRKSIDENNVAPDPGLFDELGRVTRRLRWTDEEKNCVKLGVKNHGIGKWVRIKKEFAQTLRNRTSVQIKDCWRTMSRSGEVDMFPRHETTTTSSPEMGETTDAPSAVAALFVPDVEGQTASV